MAFSDVQCFALGLLWLPVIGGCATQTDEQSRQLRELTDRVGRIQAAQDRLEERVAALDTVHRTQSPGQADKGTPAVAPSDLPVVKLSPPVAPTNEVSVNGSETDEPRTLIVGEGSLVEARSVHEPTNNLPYKRNKDKSTTVSPAKKTSAPTETGKKTP